MGRRMPQRRASELYSGIYNSRNFNLKNFISMDWPKNLEPYLYAGEMNRSTSALLRSGVVSRYFTESTLPK